MTRQEHTVLSTTVLNRSLNAVFQLDLKYDRVIRTFRSAVFKRSCIILYIVEDIFHEDSKQSHLFDGHATSS